MGRACRGRSHHKQLLSALERMDITPEQRNYWAFKLPVQAPLPVVANKDLTNPVDRFLEKARVDRRPESRTARRSADARAAGLPGSARTAADAGAGCRVRRGRDAAGVGAPHRQAARLAPLRRTLRAPLARCRALRRLGRFRVRRASAQRLALSRLRHQVVQRRQALQPVPGRADRRRRDGLEDRPDARSPPASCAWDRACCSARRTIPSADSTTSTRSSARSGRGRWG